MKELKLFWQSNCEAAGVQNFCLQNNRQTHASHLVSSGLSPEIVERMLGHTNSSTTQRYAHPANEPLKAAADVMGVARSTLQDRQQPDTEDALRLALIRLAQQYGRYGNRKGRPGCANGLSNPWTTGCHGQKIGT